MSDGWTRMVNRARERRRPRRARRMAHIEESRLTIHTRYENSQSRTCRRTERFIRRGILVMSNGHVFFTPRSRWFIIRSRVRANAVIHPKRPSLANDIAHASIIDRTSV